jgi:hypothetical protein
MWQAVQHTWHVRTDDVADGDDDTWQVLYRGHVASPGRDTCQADLTFSRYDWTSYEVTRVTTYRVTRGRMTSAADVAC